MGKYEAKRRTRELLDQRSAVQKVKRNTGELLE